MPNSQLIGLVDLDDTLLDYRGEERRAATALAEYLGVAGQPGWQEVYVKAKQRERASRSYESDPLQVRITLFAALLGIDLPANSSQQARRAYVRARIENVRTLRGAPELLDILRSTCDRVILCTSGVSDLQRRRVEAAGLRDAFDAVVVSGDVRVEKNDWKLFLGSDFRPDAHYVVISDMFDPDLKAAGSMGMFTVGIGLRHPEVDLTAADPLALVGLLRSESLRSRMETRSDGR